MSPHTGLAVSAPLIPLTVIRFTVLGRPRPQGSKRHVGNGIMVESSKALKPWRQDVAGMALALGVEMFAAHVPLELTLNFYFSRPKSAKRRGMTTKPDIDKTARAILDAIKGILITDDSQVVELHARKHYGGPERVEISIQEAL
jgi:crossover junction endodeoxyribonuclease RusA